MQDSPSKSPRENLSENLSHDPIHGYIPFVSGIGVEPEEVTEEQIIDHAWVQRLRQIHQLQTAWWVYPTAEHTRFQHVLGVMHLASRAVGALYESLKHVCPDVPSEGYVESLMRMAGLLHDVGHGPFGHFFDEHFLKDFGLTHETLGCQIICDELGSLLRRVRRNPNGHLAESEQLDPQQIAFLVARPKDKQADEPPRWLHCLRSLFCGIYTVDNMDFVLRDAYMTGYSVRAFDLDRLLRYSFFSPSGLTIDSRGIDALVRFIGARGELFRAVYFHRTVRAIDLTLSDLFAQSKKYLFPGNPSEHLDKYLGFTQWSLLVDVARWRHSEEAGQRELSAQWERFLGRRIQWHMICQRTLVFSQSDSERSSIFSSADLVERALRNELGEVFEKLPLRVDLARHVHRPDTRGPAAGVNFLFDSATGKTRPLTDDQLFRQLPMSHRICRIYAKIDAKIDDSGTALSEQQAKQISTALDTLLGGGGSDDLTNM